MRKERCEQCGRIWGVSACARYYAGVYICPQCEAKNRRTEYAKSTYCRILEEAQEVKGRCRY